MAKRTGLKEDLPPDTAPGSPISPTQWQTVIGSLTEGLVIADAAGHLVSMNQAALDLLGYQSEEEVRTHLSRFPDQFTLCALDGTVLPLEDWPMARALRGERFVDYEVVVRRHDTGREFVSSCAGTPVLDEHGRRVLALHTLRDITSQKRAQDALRESEHHLRRLLNSLFTFVGVLTPDGILVEVNEAVLGWSGYRREEVLGAPLDQSRWWANSPQLETLREAIQAAAGGESRRFEACVTIAEEETAIIDMMVAPLFDRDGRVTRLVGSATDLTDRKRDEQALERSEREFRALAEHAPDMIARFDRAGRYLYANPAVEQATGRSSEVLLGRTPREVAPELGISRGESERWHRAFDRVLRTNLEQVVEFVAPASQDAVRHFQTRLVPERVREGLVETVLAVTREITEHKHAEALLRTRARQQEAVAQLGERAIGSQDLDALIEDALGTVSHILEVELCKVLELLPDGTALHLRAGLGWRSGLVGQATVPNDAGSMAGYTLLSEGPVIAPNLREERRFAASPLFIEHGVSAGCSVPIPLQPGQPFGVLGAYSGTPRDFTRDDVNFLQAVANVLAAAIQRQRVETALRLSEERFRTALKTAPIIVFSQDLTLRYTWVYANELQRAGGIIGRSDRELAIDAADAAEIESFKRAALANGRGRRREFRIRTAHGVRHFDLTVEPVRDGDGTIVGLTGAAVDISARKALETQLREQAKQLERADRRKDEFLAMLGHELRNPLTPIQNAVQLLELKQGGLDEELLWAVQVVTRQARQLTHLVDDLLDVARITRGRIELKKNQVALQDVIAAAVETASPLITERCHHLELQLPEESLELHADPVRLAQVIANLLNNAAKYTPPGGHIRLGVDSDGDSATISVSDNGCGIDPEALPYVFELFSQEGRALDRSQGGLGLGLSLVHRLVGKHGGSVQAFSEGPGRGSEFRVRLPLPTPRRSAAPLPPQASDAASVRRRVLVVDDNPDVAHSLAELLRLLGHEVQTAADGPSALETARRMDAQVVFLDIGLPGMSGYEVARRLRLEHGHRMLLAAFTGYAPRPEVADLVDRQLLKPAGVEAIKAVLDAYQP